MKKTLLFIIIFFSACALSAQKVDSIFFHLYTDSLKKGQHNYISVDGKTADGKWMPLTEKEIQFSCATAKFQGNELILPFDFKDEKVTVKAILKSNPSLSLEKTIWIKKKPDPSTLPTQDEILNPKKNKEKKN